MSSPVSVYIHIPFCISKCEYCDFFSIPCKSIIPDLYISALCNEMDYRINKFNFDECKTLYIGGGTPSLLSYAQLKKITDHLFSKIKPSNNLEFTVELNPDDVNKELLTSLSECGVNRLSLGIQSMNDKVLKNVKRRAGSNENLEALALIKNYWKGQFSVDLISALPYETEESQIDAINKILSFSPDHISYYSLTVEEETPLGKKIYENGFDYDYDMADKLWISGRDLLIQNGYIQYEVSNFCKPGFECNHNMSYWSRFSYIGLGSGGCGTVYSGNSGFRWTNFNEIEKYLAYWNQKEINGEPPQIVENLTEKQCKFEFFMMCLRVAKGFSENQYYDIFNEELPASIKENFTKWQKNALAEISEKNNQIFYNLNEKGLLFLNKFLEEIDI